MKQNPYVCGDNHCVLLLPHVPKGQGTNGGCRCFPLQSDPETRMRVRKGIRWLAHRLAMAETFLDQGFDIVNSHVEGAHGDWLDRVCRYELGDD
jgi:hypothetical protein